MKRTAIKWIIAASAIIFLIGGTAWAGGKGDRTPNNGHGSGYHSAPIHHGGHGPAVNDQKRPPLGKNPQHEALRSPHRRPYQGPNTNHHPRPEYEHHKPYHDGRVVKVVVAKKADVHRGVALSLLTGNPLFALDAIVNHR